MKTRLMGIAEHASQPPLAKFVKAADLAAIKELDSEIERLAIASIPERGDITDQIASFETRVSEVEIVLSKAKDQAAALAATKAKADAEAAQTTIRNKGVAYANESGTSWTFSQHKNEMTDGIEYLAKSEQTPAPGVEAEITAACIKPGIVEFDALIVDDHGQPTLSFPSLDGDSGAMTVRTNDDKPKLFLIQIMKGIRAGARNQFRIGAIPTKSTPEELAQMLKESPLIIDAASTWRQMVQIETSVGDVILKLPPFADAIQRVLGSCR